MKSPFDSRHPLIGLVDEVTRLNGRLKSLFAHVRKEAGLNDSEMMVLNAVVEAAHPPTVPQIGRSLGSPRQSVQRASDSLLAAGLIARAANPDHKCAALLLATAEGLALKRRIDAHADTMTTQLSERLDPAMMRETTATLSALRRELEACLRDGVRAVDIAEERYMTAIVHDLAQLAPIDRLTDWLDTNVPELGKGPLKTSVLSGGTSNVVLTIDRGEKPMVLRRPPTVPPPGAERGVLREARILSALNGTDVPHPHCFGVCDDPFVIGARFYVMEKVEGWAPNLRDEKIHNQPPFDRMPYEYGIPFAIVDGLIKLANVDYKAIGLADYGKPGKFLERQVDRWAGQLLSYKERYGYEGRHLPGYAETEAWLRAHVLPTEVSGILHGDVGTPNMMFHHGPPARLAAMIDWELSTIGDPMLDLGWFTGAMRDEDDPGKSFPTALNNPDHFPTKQELARYYCAGTGRNIDDFAYYAILAKFKSGCLLEYKVAQAEAGILPRETGRFFARIVEQCFADTAAAIARVG